GKAQLAPCDGMVHGGARPAHVTAHVGRSVQVHVYVTDEVAVFAADHRRTGDDLHARDLAQRDLRHLPALARDGDEDVFERLRILPKLARIADVDRETAPALHGGGDRLAADGRLDHLVDVRDVQAVARQRLAIGHDVQVEPTEAPFEEGGAGARNGA